MSWRDLQEAKPELAAFGAERFAGGVAYLATVRKDGGPRVHPVTPIVGQGRLFLFMEPTSPKGHDLRRDGRYALPSAVSDAGGGNGEFLIKGRADLIEEPEIRTLAAELAPYDPADRYVLFELGVESALATIYDESGEPQRRRWKRPT